MRTLLAAKALLTVALLLWDWHNASGQVLIQNGLINVGVPRSGPRSHTPPVGLQGIGGSISIGRSTTYIPGGTVPAYLPREMPHERHKRYRELERAAEWQFDQMRQLERAGYRLVAYRGQIYLIAPGRGWYRLGWIPLRY